MFYFLIYALYLIYAHYTMLMHMRCAFYIFGKHSQFLMFVKIFVVRVADAIIKSHVLRINQNISSVVMLMCAYDENIK